MTGDDAPHKKDTRGVLSVSKDRFYLCLRKSHHPCGQHTILVRNQGSVALMGLVVHNSHNEELAENPQSQRRRKKKQG